VKSNVFIAYKALYLRFKKAGEQGLIRDIFLPLN
jgi:hypothetical protein